MPIDYKKLYQNNDIILTNANPDALVKDGTLESVDYLRNYFKARERYKPPVDFSDLKNFARFASAKKYYVDSFDRISDTYPYDGSLKERIDWELSSSFFDMYVFEEVYPRTNGHVLLSPSGWGTKVVSSDHYGAPASASFEYIFTKGGPHTSARKKEKDITDASGDYKSGYANIWEPSKNRECNLKIGGVDGNTVEFWMKKPAFAGNSKTGREVVFDAATSDYASSSVNYGRLTVEMTGTTSGNPFLLTYMSGTRGVSSTSFSDTTVTTGSVADGNWHHYAFAFKNNGTGLDLKFYFDGKCIETKNVGNSSIGYVSGNTNSTIGSLITAPSGTQVPTKGWGKLSGSLDEFRFWKDERTSPEVFRYMIEPVGGGTNTDDANTSLGVYYKFNEGITLTSSIDQTVLDYSGRISNGTFVGYNSASRGTASAMVESGLTTFEFKDPILYTTHPTLISTLDTKKKEGEIHDYANNAAIYHSLPTWIIEEDEDKYYSPLKNLTQIVGSYFDSLAEQINSLPKLKHKTYLSSSYKPAPFNNRLLQSIGFEYFPELFSDATELEYFKSRNDKEMFQKKLYDVKNRIYQNIYNNIVYINKSKGTEKSFRNLLHCFGVGDEIYRINTYGNRVKYTLKDNYKTVAEYKKYVQFGLTGTAEATVYPHSSSANPDSKAIVSGTYGLTDYLGFTMESEVHFPIRHSLADSNTVAETDTGPSRQFRTYIPYTTASLFGVHQIKSGATGNNLTWNTNDYANFQVFAIKASDYSKRCKFILTGTAGSVIGPLSLSSDYIDDVFDDTRWTFSVAVKPKSNANLPDGSSGSIGSAGYLVEFYGVEKIADYVKSEFYSTGTITGDAGSKFLNSGKAPYIGAHRTNFSGTLLQKADGNISSTRMWYSHLATGTIKQHNQDVKNYGVGHPFRSTYLYPNALSGIKIPTIDTMVLNWTFDTVTGSDGSGEFLGEDYASGSAQKVLKYGSFGEIVGKQYLPKGFNFPANSTLPINRKYVSSAKKQLPEMINSSDMVNILTDDDKFFNKVDLLRPTNYYMSIEKSMYQTISDEMIKMFSTIKDFNNLVGEPVNKYRHEYKDMAKLRQLFFERVGNTPDLDKYVDFYKWVDITLDTLLGYLVPISADMGDRYGSNVRTMVENTVLHRNKYKWQYPTLEDKTQDIEGNVLGINELLYDWKYGHAELPNTAWSTNSLLLVSGSGNALTVADTTDLSFGNGTDDVAFSVGFWMKWAAVPSGDEHFFNKGDGANAREYDVYFKKSSNRILVNLFQAAGSVKREWAEFAFNPASRVGQWTHIVVTYNGAGGTSARNGIKLYVNGAAISSATTNGINYVAMENTSELFRIGSGQAGSAATTTNTFNGNMDEFVVYKSLELSAAQALALYNNGCPRNVKAIDTVGSLVAYWRMGDGGDQVAASGIKDSSGNGHSATPRKSSGSDLTITTDVAAPCNILSSIKEQCLWWDERAEKSNDSITSLNAAVDSNKQTMQDSIVNETNASAPTLGSRDSSTGAISTYEGSTYVTRRLAKPLRLKVEESPVVKGGVNTAANKQTDLLNTSFIKHNTPGSYVKIPTTSVEDFESCNDALALNNGKRKQTFNANINNSKFGALENSYLNAKGDLYAPFDIYSGSTHAQGGYLDTISSSFKAGIDITNLHEDSYGPLYGRPMQTPFTEKFVGGKVHRHIYSNLRPNNTTPDEVKDRPEGWKIRFAGNDLYLFGGGYNNDMTPAPHIEKGAQHRDEFAKRPVNIRNIKMFTGSSTPIPGRPDQVLNATNVGNYTSNYEVAMTNGRSINNRFLAESPDGLASQYAESNAISGVIDFTLPRRDLTGSSKSIIVNRFSAPGDPITMGEGFLDVAAAEYSIYNALPWRNLSVRQPLNEWYTDHTKQFGFFSDAQTIADYESSAIAYPGGSGSVVSGDYHGNGSYHKVNRNPIRVKKYASATSTSSFADDIVYDNWFVQHSLPRTDLQYSWITASIVGGYTGAALYGHEQPDYSNASLASTDISFILTSSVENSNGVKVDFAGMNNLVVDEIQPSTNSLVAGAGNSTFGAPDPTQVLNSLTLHRQGPYGWPSWKQIRGAQHPVMRYNYKNNIQTFTKTISSKTSGEYSGQYKEIISQSMSPVTSKYDPLKYTFTYNSAQGDGSLPSDHQHMWTSYGNEKVYFTDVPDPSISGLINLNDSNVVWSKAGQIGETLQEADNKILAYDTLKKYLLWNTPGYISGTTNPIEKFHSLEIEEAIFPREHYTYTSVVRQRSNYANTFWKDSRADRNTKTVNSQGHTIHATGSIWSMDANIAASVLNPQSGSEGELQNNYSLFFSSSAAEIKAAPTYNRRIPEDMDGRSMSPMSSNGWSPAGATKWEAGEQSGYNPSYNSYEDFIEDVKRVGKDHGIIPEYRISDHMKYHTVDQASSGGFYAENPSWLRLPGANITSSADSNFYTIYSNSDFLKHFQPIDDDFSAVAMPSKLKLKCSAVTKFLPYDGFYPSERTVQLAQIFSQSFGPTAKLRGTNRNWRTLLTPFFSPGVLYNSIKSGIAVDYPLFLSVPQGRNAVLSASFTNRMPFEALVDPEVLLSNLGDIYDAEANSNSIINSTGTFGAPINDLYKSAINNFITEVPRFFLGGTDGIKGATYGPLTTFVSKATVEEGVAVGDPDDKSHISFEKDKTYKMRIVCSHSKIRNFEAISGNVDRLAQSASYIYNPPTIMMYNRAFDRTSTREYSELYYAENMGGGGLVGRRYTGSLGWSYNGSCPVYGSSFGPAIDAGRVPSTMGQGGHEPHTPPYYHGYSHIELSYTPEVEGYKTISDIISGLSASYYREPIRKASIDSGSLAHRYGMQLSASINWRQIVTKGGETRWVIQPKWECPVLDFASSDITIPTYGSGSVAKGMWHQYGEVPGSDQGVFLEIQFPEGTQAGDNVGNLANKLGFDIHPKRKIGVIPESGKTVSEAIVAVPFFEDFQGKRRFFHIDRKTINWAMAKLSDDYESDFEYLKNKVDLVSSDAIYKPAPSIVDMVKSMWKYSLPPSINFLTREDSEPFAMMFFEFEHHFTQDDLVKMWQGVLPSESRKNASSGIQHAVAEINLAVDLKRNTEILYDEAVDADLKHRLDQYDGWNMLADIPGDKTGDLGFPKNIQWMVFKVKQKARGNYYSLTAADYETFGSPSLDYAATAHTLWWLPFYKMWTSPIFKMLTNYEKMKEYYRHNWPYDFFSIVELAKIEESVVLTPRVNYPSVNPSIVDLISDLDLGFVPFYDGVSTTDPGTFSVPLNDTISPPEQLTLPGDIPDQPSANYGAAAQKFGAAQFVLLQSQPLPGMRGAQTPSPINYQKKGMGFGSSPAQQKQGFDKGMQKK
jgi:hypothetical protein